MDKNREFAELIGICWCEPEYYSEDIDKCPKCGAIYSTGRKSTDHPGYASDPRLALREMMKRDDWTEFFMSCYGSIFHADAKEQDFINIDFILDTTGKLRDKAIEWMGEAKNGL